MLHDRRVGVVLPAYNAASTLPAVYRSIPAGLVDELLLVDDASSDATADVARDLGISVIRHPANRGYGGNQKTCYDEMLRRKVDIVAMLHPDGQYESAALLPLVSPIATGAADVMLGSRFHGLDPRAVGMPAYKYYANRILTFAQNRVMGTSLSEFHTGLRAYSTDVLRRIPYHLNRDDFTFDAEFLAQCIHRGFRVGEIGSPTRYFEDSSSVSGLAALRYGLGVVATTASFWAHRRGLRPDPRFAGR